jgi:hypothetical protein
MVHPASSMTLASISKIYCHNVLPSFIGVKSLAGCTIQMALSISVPEVLSKPSNRSEGAAVGEPYQMVDEVSGLSQPQNHLFIDRGP